MVTEAVYLAQQEEEARRQKEAKAAKEAQARTAAAQITQPPKAAAATSATSAPTSDEPSTQSKPMGFDNLNPVQQSLAMLFFFLALLLDPEKLAGSGLDKIFGSILGLDPNKGQSFGTWQQDALKSGKSSAEIARGHDYRNFNFAQAATLAASDTPILELIGKHESGGDYNNYYGRNKKGESVNFSNMSVDQVLAWQRDHTRNDGYASSAVGKYQVIQKTLEACKKEMGLTGNEKFDPALQDRMAVHLLNKRGYQSFLSGKMSAETFATNISKEWASLPKDASGLSYYHGDGLNKSGVGWGTLLASVQASRSGVRSPAAVASVAAATTAGNVPSSSGASLSGLNIAQNYNPNLPYGKSATENAKPFDSIVLHVSGKPTMESSIAYSQSVDASRGGQYGYTFLIGRDGQIVQTAPLDKRTNHIKPDLDRSYGNDRSLGIALVGTVQGATPEQMKAAAALTDALQRQYGIRNDRVVGHGTIQSDRAHGLGPQHHDHGREGAEVLAYIRQQQNSPGTAVAARPAESAPSASQASPADSRRTTVSAASAELGNWLSAKLPGIAHIFGDKADPATAKTEAAKTDVTIAKADADANKPAAPTAPAAKADDEHKHPKPAVTAPALA